MALTRANCEAVLVARLKLLLEAAGLAVTVAGTNADLNDPLAWAVRRVGGSTADASTTTDAELATIATVDFDDLFDLAEYRAWQNILGNLSFVDIIAGPRSEKLSQLARQVRAMLETREAFVASFIHSLTAGYISMNFAEHEGE